MHEKGQKMYFLKIEIRLLFIEKCTVSEACVNAILKNSLGEEEKVRRCRGVWVPIFISFPVVAVKQNSPGNEDACVVFWD